MTQLSSSDLAYMRSTLEELMPDTCNILSVTYTSDGAGYGNKTWGTATANQKCRIDPYNNRMGTEMEVGAALREKIDFVVTLPNTVTLDSTNRISIGSVQYAVIGQDGGKSWKITQRVFVERVAD